MPMNSVSEVEQVDQTLMIGRDVKERAIPAWGDSALLIMQVEVGEGKAILTHIRVVRWAQEVVVGGTEVQV